MGYIKKLKNNELVGGTDKTTIYPVTSTKAVFEEVSENNFQSQEYLNNHIYGGEGGRINEESITDYNIAKGTVTKEKLTPQVQTMLDEGQKKALTPKGNYNSETEYEALDLVFDPLPGTNSSYISLQTPNVGHPVDENAEGYEEGWWEKTLDGTAVNTAQAAIDAKVGQLETQVGTAITQAETAVDEAKQETLNAYTQAEALAQQITDWSSSEISSTPSYTDQHPLSNRASSAQVGYFECGTSSTTQASNQIKAVTAGGYALPTSGGAVKIKMYAANTYTPTTNNPVKLQFNVDATTLKELRYNNEAVSPNNTWDAGEVISVYYDGTYYQASNAQGGGGKAEKIKYDNSEHGFGEDNVQDALDALYTIAESIVPDLEYGFNDMTCGFSKNGNTYIYSRYKCAVESSVIPITVELSGVPDGYTASLNSYASMTDVFNANLLPVYSPGWGVYKHTFTDISAPFICVNIKKNDNTNMSDTDVANFSTISLRLTTSEISVDETPTKNSQNLVRSGGVYNALNTLQEDVSEISDTLYGDKTLVTKGLEDADVAYVKRSGNQIVETQVPTEGFRLRLIYPVPAGTTFSTRCTLYDGITVALYSTREKALVNDPDAIELYTDTYTTEVVAGTTSSAGFLDIGWKNENGDTFTQADIDDFMSNIEVSIEYYEGTDPANSIIGKIASLEAQMSYGDSNAAVLPIPSVVQGSYVTGGGNDEGGVGDTTLTTVCATNSLSQLPYRGVKIRVYLPDNIGAWFKTLLGPTVKNSVSGLYVNGDIISCPATHNAYMIQFCYVFDRAETGADISPSDVNALIKSGDIKFVYEEKEGDVIRRTAAEDTYINAVMQVWYANSEGYLGRHNDDPVFVHISDLHGDGVRLRNALQWSEYKGVDAVINTGDNVYLSKQSGQGFVADIGSEFSVNQLQAIGNHDVKGDDTFRANSNTVMYNELIEPFESSYSMPSSSEYEDAPTYYYMDLSSVKTRIIVLNEYEQGSKNDWLNGRMSQMQIDWFISTLLSTPSNYGVLLAYHTQVVNVNIDSEHSSFFETMFDPAPREPALDGITTQPITRIIDAFISKGSVSFTYTNLLINNTTETVTVSADFSSVNAGVEFIAHLFGHTHQDTVGYYASEQTQLALGMGPGGALFDYTGPTNLANTHDLPRDGRGINQDSFNVYCIDRRNKLVKIAKVGANMTVELNKRDYLSIPYATT